MKLKDFILKLYEDAPPPEKPLDFIEGLNFTSDQPIYGDKLKKYEDEIRKCEEFDECEIVDFVTLPIVKTASGLSKSAETVKLGDGAKFKNRCFILSVFLSPKIYDPKEIQRPVKDGGAVTPTLYDPKNLTPYKNIMIRMSPEKIQDESMMGFSGTSTTDKVLSERSRITKLLDDILTNPDEYTHKGKREVMVRGFFDVHYDKLTKEDFERTEISFYEVFYLKQDTVKDGEIGLTVASMLLPKKYKDIFLQTFDGKSIILEEELIKFKEDNNIDDKWQ